MPASPTFRMADRLAQGQLAEFIAEQRAAGRSHEAVARELFAKFGVEVTRQTVANWERSGVLDAEPEDAA